MQRVFLGGHTDIKYLLELPNLPPTHVGPVRLAGPGRSFESVHSTTSSHHVIDTCSTAKIEIRLVTHWRLENFADQSIEEEWREHI